MIVGSINICMQRLHKMDAYNLVRKAFINPRR